MGRITSPCGPVIYDEGESVTCQDVRWRLYWQFARPPLQRPVFHLEELRREDEAACTGYGFKAGTSLQRESLGLICPPTAKALSDIAIVRGWPARNCAEWRTLPN